ncbi:MAG: pentapeptide repeat-containing protein [Rhodocyclaceae bacterium]
MSAASKTRFAAIIEGEGMPAAPEAEHPSAWGVVLPRLQRARLRRARLRRARLRRARLRRA